MTVDVTVDRPVFSDRGDFGVAQMHHLSDEELLSDAGVAQVFSTKDVADFFGRSKPWVYLNMRQGLFRYPDGSLIVPEQTGKGMVRRYTVPIIREMAASAYACGNIDLVKLTAILRRCRYAELGVEWREVEGWKYVHLGRHRYRWVHPDKAVLDEETGDWTVRGTGE